MKELKGEFKKMEYCVDLCSGNGRLIDELLSKFFPKFDAHDQVDLRKEWDDLNKLMKGRS